MMGIGYYAYLKSTSDVSEYMLGGRQLHPAVGALSAGASDMSGWMLMGLPGAIYLAGFSAVWIAVGLVIGAYLNYLLVAPRLRVYTEMADDAITIPDFFEKRFDDHSAMPCACFVAGHRDFLHALHLLRRGRRRQAVRGLLRPELRARPDAHRRAWSWPTRCSAASSP
jgi:Na+(H+)/acetate symporter ActP